MKVKITVAKLDEMLVQLVFINDTQRTQYLNASYLFEEAESVLNQFHFEPRNAVRYVGATVKRIPETDDDIVVLGPAERYFTELIDLKKLYKFNHRNKLKFRYSSHHPLEGIGNGNDTLESDWSNLDNGTLAEYNFIMSEHGGRFGF